MTAFRQTFFALVFAATIGMPLAAARAESGPAVGPETGLALPRFVSLATDKANARTGPGRRYPIAWVFQRKGWPLELVAEFEHWRKIRDLDGAEGWIHMSLLSGRRTAVVTGETRALLAEPRGGAPPVLRAESGVIGDLLACRPGWCRLKVSGISGWIPREQIFGELATERFD